ncbi:MAG: FlgD immunoglobulin-like domain containing protein [Candidatus Eiseniibacteriota bacterium]
MNRSFIGRIGLTARLVRCSRNAAVSLATVAALALPALAGAGVGPPAIDGNITDLIAYGAAINQDCLDTANLPVDQQPVAGDVCKTNALLIPCNAAQVACTGGGTYFENGYDLTRAVAAYDRANQTLYLGIRVAGIIGDSDGNATPDAGIGCAPPLNPGEQRIQDPAGIGFNEGYNWGLDSDCDGLDDIFVTITGGSGGVATVSVIGAPAGATLGAFANDDLEVRIQGIDLPFQFGMTSFVGSTTDGLSEDASNRVRCGPPDINVEIEKIATPPTICPGQNTTFTITVRNTGEVPLTTNLTDLLPAGLTFNNAVTGDFAVCNQVGQLITFCEIVIPVGESRTVSFQALAANDCLGLVTNSATVVGTFSDVCILALNDNQPLRVEATDTADVTCQAVPCVTLEVTCNPERACPGTPITVTATATNCGQGPEDITITLEGQSQTFPNIGPGGTATFTRVIPMPECTDGELVSFDGEATATTGCGTTPEPARDNCTVECLQPQVSIEKSVDPVGQVAQGTTLHYTITVTNTSKDVTLTNVRVVDTLCDDAEYQNNANPAADSEPPIGSSGQVVWTLASLAPQGVATFSFDVRIRELAPPECEDANRSCTNNVTVEGFCGDARADASASVTTPIEPCVEEGICRLTGGGCLNEDGDNRGHKQSTFGGNSSPFHEGGGPTGNEWQHVYRDGRTILFNWHSHDAHVIRCTVVEPGPCHPPAVNTRADFVGTGQYSLGAGSRTEDGNMVAYIIDHREGSCNRNTRDEYSIIVRTGLEIGAGEIVFQTSGEIDCGNLQIHETPARLFGGGAEIPDTEIAADLSKLAMLNRAVPNPFSASMSYSFQVAEGSSQSVDVGVYNVAGRLVSHLAQGERAPGIHTVTWDGRSADGARVAAGVYFVKARIGASAPNVTRVIYVQP